jgi:hypothetical protein
MNALHRLLSNVSLEGIGIQMLATVLATALLCRIRLRCGKRISYGTLFVGASIFPFLLCLIYILWVGIDDWNPPLRWLQTFGIYLCVCALPAFCVVHNYQRKSK